MRSPCTATKNSCCSPQLEKARVQQRRPNTAKKKNNKKTNNELITILINALKGALRDTTKEIRTVQGTTSLRAVTFKQWLER